MSAARREPMPLVIVSKSAWAPAIRREHALARLASAHGHAVTFLERPLDVRALGQRASARRWLAGMRGCASTAPSVHSVRVVAHSTIFPGHLNAPSELTSNLLLRQRLRRLSADAVVVVDVPWQWPATSAVRGRRVFDCADDWRVLAEHRSQRIGELYRRIAREADAIVLVDPALADQFPPSRTVVVRNGVSDDMLTALSPRSEARRLIHAGTLTPRFDAPLAAALLDLLPEWSLDLYGQCQYPGCQERPGPELARLLSEHGPRVRWHGAVDRGELSQAIDRAAVALILNRPELSRGQDSMKLYDYAARGRPIASTPFAPRLSEQGPPHMRVAGDARELATAVLAGFEEPDAFAHERRAWAERERWDARWEQWSRAIFGMTGQERP
jgi:hypothetical protein